MKKAIRFLDRIFTAADGRFSGLRAALVAAAVFAVFEMAAPGRILFPVLAALAAVAAGYAAHRVSGHEEDEMREETDYGAPPEPDHPSRKKKTPEKDGRMSATFSGGGGGGPANKGVTGPRAAPPAPAPKR